VGAASAESSGQRAPVLVIRAVAVAPEDDDPESLRLAVAAGAGDADLVLLDTRVAERFGGRGAAFRWSLRAAYWGRPVFSWPGGLVPRMSARRCGNPAPGASTCPAG
jgi:phosphoribosylanthranilate isomerase